jgi:hypothetical protein
LIDSEGQRHAVAGLPAQQLVNRNSIPLTRQIEQRHFKSRAQKTRVQLAHQQPVQDGEQLWDRQCIMAD